MVLTEERHSLTRCCFMYFWIHVLDAHTYPRNSWTHVCMFRLRIQALVWRINKPSGHLVGVYNLCSIFQWLIIGPCSKSRSLVNLDHVPVGFFNNTLDIWAPLHCPALMQHHLLTRCCTSSDIGNSSGMFAISYH